MSQKTSLKSEPIKGSIKKEVLFNQAIDDIWNVIVRTKDLTSS